MAAMLSSLRLALACGVLSAADARPGDALLRELLRDAAAHGAPALRAAAALLTPPYLAAVAGIASVGLSQVCTWKPNIYVETRL